MTTKQDVKRLQNALKSLKKRLAKDRDDLRDIIYEAEDLLDCDEMEEDLRALERFADNLSRFV